MEQAAHDEKNGKKHDNPTPWPAFRIPLMDRQSGHYATLKPISVTTAFSA
jgi:hypothetical protein